MGSATSTRALLLTFAIAIVVLIFGTSLLLYDLRQTDIQQAKYQLTGLSRILAEQTSKSLESISLVMRSAEERLSDPLGRRLDLDDNPVTFLLKARASGLPQLRSLFILDQRGNLANSSLADLSEPLSLADRSYYQHFLSNPKTEFYLSPPMRSRLDQEWSIFISTPLLDEAKSCAAFSSPPFDWITSTRSTGKSRLTWPTTSSCSMNRANSLPASRIR